MTLELVIIGANLLGGDWYLYCRTSYQRLVSSLPVLVDGALSPAHVKSGREFGKA